jgi:hypothetical protein
MKDYTIDESQRKAAKFAGVAYLFTFAIVVYANFGIYDPLHVPGNALETAKRISENKYLFRFGIVLDLLYAIGFTVLLSSLYSILKDVNKRVVTLAVVWQLVYVIVWVAFTLKFFDALRLASGAKYLGVFANEELSALSRLFLWARFDRYYGVLLFYSLGSMLFNYLWFKSGYIPKALAMWGIIACAWCAVCTVAYLIYPELGNSLNLWFYDTPMALFDITLSVWFLVKGLGK